MKGLTKTRGRKVATAVVSTLLVCAAVGFAYYLSAETFTGETSTKAGKATGTVKETLTLSIPAGIVPGQSKEMTASVKPAEEHVLNAGAKMKVVSITTNPSTCKVSWFNVTYFGQGEAAGPLLAKELLSASGTAASLKLTAAKSDEVGEYALQFANAPEDQSACQEAEIKVKMELTGVGT